MTNSNRPVINRARSGTQIIGHRIYRHRDRYVEAFSGVPDVPLERGYFDKLKVEFTAITLHFDNIGQYQRFRRNFTNSGVIIRDASSNEPKIRGDWLFSGSIRFNRISEDDDRSHSNKINFEVKYVLNLNPTRFLYHAFHKLNQNVDDFSLEGLLNIDIASLLHAENIPEAFRSLDNGDNYIPYEIFKLVRPFGSFMELYITQVLTFLGLKIHNSMEVILDQNIVSDLYMTDEMDHYTWTLKSAEVYWEYSVVDALLFVNDLWHGFQSVLNEIERRGYTSAETQENEGVATTGRQQRHNGIAIYANNFGVANQKLAVYAKTYTRVRFELRYNKSIRRLFPQRETSEIGNELAGLYQILDLYKQNARRRLLKLMNAMPSLSISERSEYALLADFLHELSSAHEGIEGVSVGTTMSRLLHNHRVVVTRDTEDHTVMRRLESSHIVKRSRPHLREDGPERLYRLNDAYHALVMNFRRVLDE